MPKRLIIVQDQEGWNVLWEGERISILHRSMQAAVKFSRLVVRKASQGYCSQVLLQNLNGESEAIWTYGKDAYPLRWWQRVGRRIWQ